MSSFAALSRQAGFRAIVRSTAAGEKAARLLPLTASRQTATGDVSRIALSEGKNDEQAGQEREEALPSPTPEQLRAAEEATARAEQALGLAHAEVRQLKAQLESERRAGRELVDAFERGLTDARQELRAGYARLVLEGSRRLLGVLDRHDAVFLARLDEVAELLVLESDVIIKVAPRNKEVAEAAVFGRAGWLVEIDPRIDGGCVAVCRNSTVDARLETAFASLTRALEAWLADDGQASPGRG